ncbi:hypothetical protein [Microbacterium sp. PMB16]|uniref:hypothetical protein n=1 Tax=Microbacterium sp. PMB16 TaxID=3120157 RepID=UPI003F4C0BBE
MGLKDWISSKVAANMQLPDYAGDISAQLADGEEFLGFVPVTFPGAKSTNVSYQSLGAAALSLAANAVTSAVSKSQHIGGEEGSIAHGIPRDLVLGMLALTSHEVGVWYFGDDNTELPGEHVVSVPRADVASIALTGKKGQGGQPELQLRFSDGSWVNVHAMPGDYYADFWNSLPAFAAQ